MKEEEKPKEISQCPFCGEHTITLVKDKRRHISKNSSGMLEGWWWVYKCDSCKEGFTSTESDTISLKNFKHRKL